MSDIETCGLCKQHPSGRCDYHYRALAERVVEAARDLQYASQGVRFAALREALGALDG